MKKIGFFVGSKLAPDAKNFLINMGEMYSSYYHLDAVGSFPPDPKIEHYFDHKKYYGQVKIEGSARLKQGFLNCRKYALSERPDLIFQFTKYPIYGIVVSSVGRFFSVPTLVRLTGDHFRAFRYKGENLFETSKILMMQNVIGAIPLRISTRVAVLSKRIKEEAIRKGCQEDKIDLLPQPIDKKRFSQPSQEEKERIRDELNFPKNKKIIIYVGRLTEPKGLSMLEEGLAYMSENKNFLFCLIGQGPYGPKLEKKFPELVRFEGFVDTDKVHNYYKASDLLVHPSPLEGVPNTLLEAMAVRIPVIAREADYSRELRVPTFENVEELEDMLKSDWKLTPLPERFKWDNLKDKYMKVINKTIKNGGKK